MTRSILLVEDDAALREVLAEALELEAFRVECSAHGADALGKLRAGLRPDVILLDLMMPVMDGWEFRDAQLADGELAGIPVVVVTAAGTLSRPIDAREIVHKPFRIEDLVGAVERAGAASSP